MKKRFIAIFFALVLALPMSACGSHSSTPDPAPAATVLSDAQFASAVRDHTDSFDLDSDASIVTAAHSVCDAWSRGVTIDQVEAALASDGMLNYDSGFLVGAATRVYCPQYADKLSDVGSTSITG